jgi:hypothetical protein
VSEPIEAPSERWRAVEPELTHFFDIDSLDFDIASDRGTSDTYREVELPQDEASWPWQRLTLAISGRRYGGEKSQTISVGITFYGVVFFEFLQDDFLPKVGEEPDEHYDLSGIRGVPGFNVGKDRDDTWGVLSLGAERIIATPYISFSLASKEHPR